ncbi:MAG: FUSC family protein [Albidovulum sp.]
MLSIIAVKNGQLLYLTRDCILQTVALQLVAIPVLYLLIPTRTTALIFPGSIIPEDSDVAASLIRAGVLLALSFTIFTRLPISDIALSIAAVFGMMFPDHDIMFRRVMERIVATFFGAALAVLIALAVGWNGHFIVLIGLVFLACVVIGQKMFDGWYHSAMYQYMIIAMLIVLQTALTTSDWNRAALLRVTLTLLGGGGGAIVVAALESWLRQYRQRRALRVV